MLLIAVSYSWRCGRNLRAKLDPVINSLSADHAYLKTLYGWRVVQGVQFDLDSPLTLRLEFARSNTKTTCTKPQQQQQLVVASSSKSTAACLHATAGTMSVASLTGCKYGRVLRRIICNFISPT